MTCILQKLQWLPPTPLQNYDLFNMRSIQQSLQTVRSMCTDSQKKKFRYTVHSRYTLLRIRIQIGLVLRTFVDPDPYSEYGSGSTQVNLDKFAPDPNWSKIQDPNPNVFWSTTLLSTLRTKPPVPLLGVPKPPTFFGWSRSRLPFLDGVGAATTQTFDELT